MRRVPTPEANAPDHPLDGCSGIDVGMEHDVDVALMTTMRATGATWGEAVHGVLGMVPLDSSLADTARYGRIVNAIRSMGASWKDVTDAFGPALARMPEELFNSCALDLVMRPEHVHLNDDVMKNIANKIGSFPLPPSYQKGHTLPRMEAWLNLVKLPDGIDQIGGDLLLVRCPSFQELPATLRKVEGMFSLEECVRLEELPESLEVGSHLDLIGCGLISALPSHLAVGGILQITRTSIEYLPHDIRLGGGLWFSKSGLASLEPLREIHGDLRGGESYGLKAIPDGFRVNGDVKLNDSSVERIGEGVVVTGELILRGCGHLVTLPVTMEVAGGLHMEDSGWDGHLPEGVKVGGQIYTAEFPWVGTGKKGKDPSGKEILEEAKNSGISPDIYRKLHAARMAAKQVGE